MGKRLIVVGNAPHPGGSVPGETVAWDGVARFIDECDPVIRFNGIANQSAAWTGRRTDILYFRGHALPAYEFARWGIRFEHVDAPKRAISVMDFYDYPRPNLDPYDKIDYTEKVAARNGFANYSYLDGAAIAWARTLVADEGSRLMPSLGMVALVHVLSDPAFAAHDKYIAGFGFAGWDGHDWACEKRIVERWLSSGVLRPAS